MESKIENDDWKRPRTIEEIRQDIFAGMYFAATGKWPDIADPSKVAPRPNHVRDAVEANR